MRARKVILTKETKEAEYAQESHNHASIITEVINHAVCGFITPIDIDKRVFLHNTHIVSYTSIPFTVGMRVLYVEQVDSLGRKVAVNCKVSNNECTGKSLHIKTRDRSRSKYKRRDLFKIGSWTLSV